jgi:signal transduction histidine kinase
LFSTKSFGTGLGLPTVKQLVEQHRGTISIDSKPGQGTAVRISLPISGQQSMAA